MDWKVGRVEESVHRTGMHTRERKREEEKRKRGGQARARE